MADLTVGQASLRLVPSFQGFAEDVDAQMAEQGQAAGKAFSDAFNSASNVNPSIGPSTEESTRQGTASGGEFADSFKAKLTEAFKSLPNAPIDADSTDAEIQIANIRADLQALSNQRIGIDISDDEALARIGVLNAALKEVGAQSESIQVKVDTSAAVTELAAFKAEVDAASGSSGGGGLEGLTADSLSAGGGLGKLATAALSLGPALVPIGATLVAGIGALIPMLVAAGSGLGAFALAASGDFKGLEADASQTLTAFQKLTESTVEPVIGDSLKLLIPVFSALVPLVDSTASELDKLVNSASGAFDSPIWQGFITFIASQAGPAIDSFAHLFGGLATTFAGVTVAIAPLITGLEGDLDGIGNKFASFGQSVGSSSSFGQFIAYIQQEAPVVGQLMLNLGTDAAKFTGDLAPLGAATLSVLDPLTKFAGTLLSMHGPFGTNIVDVGLAAFAFTKLAPLATSAALAIKTFGIAVTDQAAFGSVAGGATGLEKMVAAFGGVGPAAAIAVPVLAATGAAFFLAGNEAATAAAQAKAFLDGVTTESASSLPQLSDKLADLKSKLNDLVPAYDSGKLGFAAVAEASTQLQSSLKQTVSEQSTYHDNLDTLSLQLGISDSAVEKLASSLNINLGTALDPSQLRQFKAALQEQAAQAGLTEAAFEHMAAADGVSFTAMTTAGTTAASTATTAWKNYGNAINQFSSGTLPATSANIAQFYSLNLLQATQFSANIQKAIKDGYNPALISSILQAGPAQAAPLLTGLVSAQGTGLVTLVNQTTAALASEGQQAVEEARLTAIAVAANSSTIAAQLPQALALSQALTTTNAAAAVQAVATQFGNSTANVQAIAHTYGIALPNAITSQISAAQAAAQGQVAAALAPFGNAALASHAGVIFNQNLVGGFSEGGTFKSFSAGGFAAVNAIVSGAESEKSALYPVGEDLSKGMAAGIADATALAALGAAAASSVSFAKTAAQNAAQSHSPSLLFANEVGTYLTQGIAQGMTDETALNSIKLAANNVITVAIAAVNPLKNALGQLTTQELSLESAESAEETAQKSLTQARQDATNQLTNYQDQLADGLIQSDQLQLSLQQAQAQLATDQASGTATPLQLNEDALAVSQATQAIKDQADQYQQLQEAATAAAQAGVDGNQQVVTALQAVSTAQAAVTAATTGTGANGQTRVPSPALAGTPIGNVGTPNGQARLPTAAVGIISAPSPQSAPMIPAGQLVGTAIGPLQTVGTQIFQTPADAQAQAMQLATLQRMRGL